MILLDTHALVWLLEGDAALGRIARQAIDDADQMAVSIMSFWEVAMLASKRRLALSHDVHDWIDLALAVQGMRCLNLEVGIVLAANDLPGGFHKDPADRLIVATAREKRLALVTADRLILDYGIKGHVEAVDARV